jgi:hypothetical protein
VVYVGPDAVPGIPAALDGCRSAGMRLGFVTNNASRTPEEVAAHLTELGVHAGPDDVITSSQAAASVVRARLGPGARVLPVGGPGVAAALAAADVIVLCPSNPIVSLGPILAVPGLRDLLTRAPAPKVAVSPIVGGRALKGPADQMLAGLGHDVSSLGVARLYQDFLDGLVLDEEDSALAPEIEALGMRVLVTRTIMGGADDRRRLAEEVLAFAETARPAVRAGR